MKNKKIKIISLSVSIVIHLIFIAIATWYTVPGVITPGARPQRRIQVKVYKEKNVIQLSKAEPFKPTKAIKFKSPKYVETIETFLAQEQAQEKKGSGLPKKDFEKLVKSKPPEDLPEVDDILPDYEIFQTQKKRKPKKDLAEAVMLSYGDIVDDANEFLSKNQLMNEFADKKPGFSRALTSNIFNMTERKKAEPAKTKELSVIERKQQVGDFESELVWILETYEDMDDQQKYFKITIQVGEKAVNLPTLSKEILFLVDCSISVEEQRLEEFKEGMKYSLKQFNEDDFFNIIAFKERLIKFSPDSVKFSPENLEAAIHFIEELRLGEKTDTYEALYENIKRKPKRNPSYIVLLSDGRPTKGVTNSRELINKISEINNGKIPIFAFSGGLRVNKYLLDFISYKNRGWTEYSYRTHYIGENLGNMYAKIDEPIILNLRYFMSGVRKGEIFPTVLPDFFRNAEFTLYGKYTDEDKFVMQLLGNVGGKSKEFVMEGSFKEAYEGDEQIAEDWAFNKIYHLIGLLKYDEDNKDLLVQIDELSKKFELKTPYLDDILK